MTTYNKHKHPLKNDGVKFSVNWAAFKPGTSIFIPCLGCQALRDKMVKVVQSNKMVVQMKIVIEEGIRGLRVWRLK